MPLTSHSGDMAGNIPLILLAGEDDGPPYHHARARQGYTANFAQPCIISSELGGTTSKSRCAIWLPTPTLTGHASRRRLLVTYEMRLTAKDILFPKVYGAQFQVYAMSRPARPSSVQTSFSSSQVASKSLSSESADAEISANANVVSLHVEIDDVSAPGDPTVIEANAVCYLLVRMPCDPLDHVSSLVFRLLGVAVDQW